VRGRGDGRLRYSLLYLKKEIFATIIQSACPLETLAAVGLDPISPSRDQRNNKQNQENEK
jgi:hypothetical protein